MREKLYLKGCGTALVTPFRDGKPDYDAFGKCIERQVKSGVDFLVPLATTGETPTLSAEEKIKLLDVAHSHCGGLPLLVGVGSNSVAATLENMRLVSSVGGADAYLVVVPFYNKPTQEGQYQYFKTIAKESGDIPIVIYNVPGRTGANMSADTCVRLANDCPNIIGIKEASGNYDQVSEMIRRTPKDFSVLSGDDDLTLAIMATGGQGVISVASNIAPVEVSSLTKAMLQGDLDKARALHHRLFPLFKNCFIETNPIPAKAAMSLLGLTTMDVRLPLSPASEQTIKLMSKTIEDLWKK